MQITKVLVIWARYWFFFYLICKERLPLLNLYIYIILFGIFIFNTLLIWLPWRTKIKSVLNKLKVYNKKISCIIFFIWLFIFVLLLFGPILKYIYRKNKSAKGSYELIIQPCFCGVSSVRKHFSLEEANFSLFSQKEKVVSPLISRTAWTLRLVHQISAEICPNEIFWFFFFFFFFFFVIPLSVYIRSIEL